MKTDFGKRGYLDGRRCMIWFRLWSSKKLRS